MPLAYVYAINGSHTVVIPSIHVSRSYIYGFCWREHNFSRIKTLKQTPLENTKMYRPTIGMPPKTSKGLIGAFTGAMRQIGIRKSELSTCVRRISHLGEMYPELVAS